MYSCEFMFSSWRELNDKPIPIGDNRILGYNVADFFDTPMPKSFTSDNNAEQWWAMNFRGPDIHGIWPYYELASDYGVT